MKYLHQCNSYFCQDDVGIHDIVRTRGLGELYKRQSMGFVLLYIHIAMPQDEHDTNHSHAALSNMT